MIDNTSTTSPLRILLVEDSKHDAIAFCRALEQGGLVVEITHLLRAEEALESLALSPALYDMVVADYKLPGMTGLDLCKYIISQKIPLPCIIVTGAGTEHIAVEALKAGVCDYLVKDFQQNYFQILPLLLSKVINKYRQNQTALIFEQERQAVAAISELFLASDDNDKNQDMVYEKLPQILATKFDFPISAVLLLAENKNDMIVRGITGLANLDLLGTRLPLEQTIFGATILSGLPMVLTNIVANPDLHCFLSGSDIETCLSIPIKGRRNEVLGAVTLGDVINRFNADIHIPALQVIANHLGQEIERKLAKKALQKEIGKRRQSEERLRKSHEDLQEKAAQLGEANKAKSEFLANMSHELRTPLNAIIGFSEILEQGMAGAITEDQKECIAEIRDSGKHLLSLISDILDFSKIEACKVELNLNEFNLSELVEQSLVMFKEKAMKHRIKLEMKGYEGLQPIVADERKIKQVLYNLLSNAMKFTPEGGCVTVGVRQVSEGDEYAEVSVTDTGIGISAENLKNLFQPFRQGEYYLNKSYEGTGLGLVLSKRFVEMHNGRIWVKSEVDEGSTFVFLIPVAQNQIH